ncbi:MAG: ATP-binding protein, partial [Caldilineaceae bacterium]|nr:ATP-binding protein [Caldilineaceae bacterium]
GSLWIGSEGGVTRYDGRTWETLSVDNILPNASIFSIAYTLDGTYLFGGKDGLTYYHQESTPPWIRIEPISGAFEQLAPGEIQLDQGEPLGIRYVVGDLYTAAGALDVIYRLSGPEINSTWTSADGDFVELPSFAQIGAYTLEMVARDQAFNYSEPARLTVNVVTPPATVNMPLVGAVESELLFAFVVIGLVALISFGYMSVGIIQSRRRTREALIRGYNPFVSGEPVRREDMFFGRQELLQRIVDTLHNNSIMIHGERRIGKTTLLYQLAARLREVDDAEYWFIPLYIDLEGTTESGFFHFLMEEILNGAMTMPSAKENLQPEFEDLLYRTTPTDDYSDREFSRDLREVIKVLQAYGETRFPNKQLRLILLLDEMDVMSSYSRLVQQRLRRIFMRDFAATLGAVVAGIQISKDWDRVESPWYNLFNEIALGPFNRDQAIELLTEPIRDFYRYEPAAIEYIIAHSDGRPYRLQQHALEAVNHMLADGRREIRMQDVEYAHEHIQHMNSDTHIGLDMNGSQPDTSAETAEAADDATPADEDRLHRERAE